MTSPGRTELAEALDRLVKASGLVSAEVARRAGVSEATMSRYLRGKVTPKPAAVRKISTALGMAEHGDAVEALQLAEDLHQGAAHRVVILRAGSATLQSRWAALEAETELVKSFTPLLVPGTLQTEAYLTAVFASSGRRTGAALAAAVENRLARQAPLQGPEHRFTIVMTEGALRWRVISGDVMAEQCDRIAHAARTATAARIGIIPWTTPINDLFPMTNFDVHDDRRVIIGTDHIGTVILDRPLDVQPYVAQFERVTARADFGEAAAVHAERIADEYRKPA